MSLKLVLTDRYEEKTIKHHRKTRKGERITHETKVRIAEWRNTGKYPKKKDEIITI